MECSLLIGLDASDAGHIFRKGLFELLLVASINPKDTPEALV